MTMQLLKWILKKYSFWNQFWGLVNMRYRYKLDWGGGDVVLSCPLTNPKKVHATNHRASMWRDLNHLKP